VFTRSLAALAPVLLLCACSPPILKGTSDLKLRAILDARSANAESIAPLLADDVEVHTAGTTVRGAGAGAAALAALKPEGLTRIDRHHGVSAVALGDGRLLLIQRSPADRVIRAVEIEPPGPAGTMPQRFVYWGAAWNTDAHSARRDLVAASWAEHGFYVDPGHEVLGVDEVSRMIGNLRMVAPGSVLHYVSGLGDSGGGWRTEEWVMVSRLGGRRLFVGYDVIHLDADGKIDFLAGFIGQRR
jgi:hypothetical protein